MRASGGLTPATRARERYEHATRAACFEQGRTATEHADDYVFLTVFFAAVLFFAGISLRFVWVPVRLVVMISAAGLLIYASIELTTLPTL